MSVDRAAKPEPRRDAALYTAASLLLRELGSPIVMTSGNLSDEPICTTEEEALDRLSGIADAFLVHDVRSCGMWTTQLCAWWEDVSSCCAGPGATAPLPVQLRTPLPCVLALGAHIKNSIALSVGSNVFISQHIGDLETSQAWSAFRKAAADLPRIFGASLEMVACDLHPEYLSTKYAAQLPVPTQPVQHHWAHALACMAENELESPALAVSWDGTGYGLDGTIWGGEFLLAHRLRSSEWPTCVSFAYRAAKPRSSNHAGRRSGYCMKSGTAKARSSARWRRSAILRNTSSR